MDIFDRLRLRPHTADKRKGRSFMTEIIIDAGEYIIRDTDASAGRT